MKRVLIIGLLLLLVGAIAVQIGWQRKAGAGKGKHLAVTLSAQVAGWTSQEVPLGPNEVVRGAVEKTLRYDDVFFREYRSGDDVVSVYAAYWGPGAMPTQLVASHTPDRCWVENGWKCEAIRHQETIESGTVALRPGEWRVFSAPGQEKLQVQFWHLVGDQTYDYGDRLNTRPSPWRWWRDAARQVISSPPEQYFIRITSRRPFAELAGNPGWERLLADLGRLGLAPRPAAAP